VKVRVGSADREEGSTPWREQDDREANAGGRKAAGNRDVVVRLLRTERRGITGRIRALVARSERALTRSGEPVEMTMIKAPELKDKLDAATASVAVVNGPEDATFDWDAVDWRRVKDEVRRLRQRIFTASQAGDLKRVRSLQKLMLRSRSNTLASVRRVTELNAGRLTAGVDGEVVLTPQAKARLVDRIEHPTEPFRAMPVRRVYIPKRGSPTKRRPLGIPTVTSYREVVQRVFGFVGGHAPVSSVVRRAA
jgi:hypothetical protein